METSTRQNGITFAVHDVTPAAMRLQTVKTRDGISILLANINESKPEPIFYCSEYNSNSIAGVGIHPLFAAVHLAFSNHLPLVLSPDMIWITIVQGFSLHVRNNAETLRERLVKHQGKLKIEISRSDILEGSPENDWDDVIHQLSSAVSESVGGLYSKLVTDFSTTTIIERTACEIALLDTFSPYFTYYVRCICGIPSITLEGQPADWKRLREKLECLSTFGLDLWLTDMRIILDQFERACRGDVDKEFWQNIYKQKKAYGAEIVNGWITRFVPYLKNYTTGDYSITNFTLGTPMTIPEIEEKEGFAWRQPGELSTDMLPSGISSAQVEFVCLDSSKHMRFLGGFMGIEQLEEGALRPRLGWAVKFAEAGDLLLADLPPDCQLVPAQSPAVVDESMQVFARDRSFDCFLPADFLSFYKTCDGIIFDAGQPAKIRSVRQLEAVPRPKLHPASSLPFEEGEECEDEESEIQLSGALWLRICDLPNNMFVAMEMKAIKERPFVGSPDFEQRMFQWTEYCKLPDLNRVCLIDPAVRQGYVIAASFPDFIKMFIASRGDLFDQETFPVF